MTCLIKTVMKRIEYNILDLCDEIDALKEERDYYKALYEREVRERSEETNQRLEEAKKGVATAILFCLSVKDDENGNLVVPASERKALASRFKE